MFKFFVSPAGKKVVGLATAAVSGIIAVVGALNDQKQAREFAAMKQAISELQKNK